MTYLICSKGDHCSTLTMIPQRRSKLIKVGPQSYQSYILKIWWKINLFMRIFMFLLVSGVTPLCPKAYSWTECITENTCGEYI